MNKKIGVGQPKVMENAKILIANTAMDTDKIKIYGSRVRVDSMNKARAEPTLLPDEGETEGGGEGWRGRSVRFVLLPLVAAGSIFPRETEIKGRR